MTGNGALLAAGGVLSVLAWWWFGYPATLPLAAACLLPLFFGLPWRLARRLRTDLRLSTTSTRLERGTDLVIVLADHLGQRGTATVEVHAGPRTTTAEVMGGRPAEVRLPDLPRGRHLVRVGRVVAADGTGLWRRVLSPDPAELGVIVLPRLRPMPGPGKTLDPLTDGRAAPTGTGTGSSFAALRQYQPGDDVRTIDWAASARSPDRTLYVRQLVPALVTGRLVVLDPVTPADARDAFEEAVDVAYSLLRAAGGNCALWCPGDGRLRRTPAEIEDRLVTIRPVDGPRPVRRPPSGIPAAATVTVSVGNDGEVVLRGPVAA
jgi:uncharacterized protein (DUF58 family)